MHSKVTDDFFMFEIEKNMEFLFMQIMIKFTLCGFSPINILAMVYVMCFILFQCIRMIESEKIYDFNDFFFNCEFNFFGLKT